jgi:hypothetical protein
MLFIRRVLSDRAFDATFRMAERHGCEIQDLTGDDQQHEGSMLTYHAVILANQSAVLEFFAGEHWEILLMLAITLGCAAMAV